MICIIYCCRKTLGARSVAQFFSKTHQYVPSGVTPPEYSFVRSFFLKFWHRPRDNFEDIYFFSARSFHHFLMFASTNASATAAVNRRDSAKINTDQCCCIKPPRMYVHKAPDSLESVSSPPVLHDNWSTDGQPSPFWEFPRVF